MPAPNVDSAVIRLDIRKEPPVSPQNEKLMFEVVKGAFSQRRKTLKNCLVNAGFNKDKVAFAIQQMNFDENIRGEKLSIVDFGKLSVYLSL